MAFRPNIVDRDAKDGAGAVIEVRWTIGRTSGEPEGTDQTRPRNKSSANGARDRSEGNGGTRRRQVLGGPHGGGIGSWGQFGVKMGQFLEYQYTNPILKSIATADKIYVQETVRI